MEEYSRILIEEYCEEHPKTKKAKTLSRLVEMSYDIEFIPSDEDGVELEKLIHRERNANGV